MATYAALLSLAQLVATMLEVAGGLFNIHNRVQLLHLHIKVTTLLDFLDEPSANYMSNQIPASLETRMRDEAHRAEDLIRARNSEISDSDATMLLFQKMNTIFLFFCIWFLVTSRDAMPEPLMLAIFETVLGWAICSVGGYVVLGGNDFLDLRGSRAYLTRHLDYVLKNLDKIIEEVRGNQQGSAHAALLSLRKILDAASESSNKPQLESLHEKVTFLLEFQGTAYSRMTSTQVQTMEEKTRVVVHKAERVIESDRKSFRLLIIFMLLALLLCFSALALARIPFSLQLVPGWVIIVILGYGVFEVWGAMKKPAQELCQVIDEIGMIVQDVKTSMSVSSSSSSKKELGGRVVGLEEDMEEIMGRLSESSSELKVISIVGMGGIGKTTLATRVYNDDYVARSFDIRAWVTVSQEYSLRHVLLGLLDSAKILTEQMQEEKVNENLALFLYQNLYGRRFLVVIDDLWDKQIWNFLRGYFPDNGKGSRVISTSRLSDVARYSSSGSRLHEKRCLDEDQSWSLLREKVFGPQGCCPSELESIGKNIAKGCGGLPLAILVIGGVLSKQKKHNIIWEEVAKNLVSGKIEDQCLEKLDLSYKHLPYHLRPCFLYIGVFLRDSGSEISVSRLIYMWIAEGFLKPRSGRTLEEEAEYYLKELVDRNLILERTRSCNGRIRTYGIHDLLRDVCMVNAQKENFFLSMNAKGIYTSSESTPQQSTPPRRLSIQPDALQNGGHGLISSYPNLRSFLCAPTASKLLHSQSRLYLDFRYLRVLDVLVLHFGKFPVQIIALVCLRYLALSSDGPLPSSMFKLHDLETIVHHHCSNLKEYPSFPRVIWSMPNLRYLYVKPGFYLSRPLRINPFSRKISILEHLQTLVGIRNFKWSEGIITRIPNLKKLGMSYRVSSSVDWSMYELECLADLQQLESLKIVIEYYDEASTSPCDPPQLVFPENLKKLSLSGCGIPWESFGTMPKLEALKLRDGACSGHSWETTEEQFPQLMFLLIENIGFTSWETREDPFARLQRLVVRKCRMLEEIPYDIFSIATLEMIELDDCHPSAIRSAKDMLREQGEMGNETLKGVIRKREEKMELANSQI